MGAGPGRGGIGPGSGVGSGGVGSGIGPGCGGSGDGSTGGIAIVFITYPFLFSFLRGWSAQDRPP
jgi:hypothetical protein